LVITEVCFDIVKKIAENDKEKVMREFSRSH
jgi:hypothetical protein